MNIHEVSIISKGKGFLMIPSESLWYPTKAFQIQQTFSFEASPAACPKDAAATGSGRLPCSTRKGDDGSHGRSQKYRTVGRLFHYQIPIASDWNSSKCRMSKTLYVQKQHPLADKHCLTASAEILACTAFSYLPVLIVRPLHLCFPQSDRKLPAKASGRTGASSQAWQIHLWSNVAMTECWDNAPRPSTTGLVTRVWWCMCFVRTSGLLKP